MGGGGDRGHLTFFTRKIFADLPGKEGQGRKVKLWKWRGKKGRFEREDVENWKWKGKKVWKWAEDLFCLFVLFCFLFLILFLFVCLFCFVCFCFCFVLFCFVFCLSHLFWSHWNFVCGVPKIDLFYLEKTYFARETNREKWLCPLRKIFLLRQCHLRLIYCNYHYCGGNFRSPLQKLVYLAFFFLYIHSMYTSVPMLWLLVCFVSLSVGSTINYLTTPLAPHWLSKTMQNLILQKWI